MTTGRTDELALRANSEEAGPSRLASIAPTGANGPQGKARVQAARRSPSLQVKGGSVSAPRRVKKKVCQQQASESDNKSDACLSLTVQHRHAEEKGRTIRLMLGDTGNNRAGELCSLLSAPSAQFEALHRANGANCLPFLDPLLLVVPLHSRPQHSSLQLQPAYGPHHEASSAPSLSF